MRATFPAISSSFATFLKALRLVSTAEATQLVLAALSSHTKNVLPLLPVLLQTNVIWATRHRAHGSTRTRDRQLTDSEQTDFCWFRPSHPPFSNWLAGSGGKSQASPCGGLRSVPGQVVLQQDLSQYFRFRCQSSFINLTLTTQLNIHLKTS